MNKHRTHKTGWDRLLSGVLCLALVLGLMPAVGLVQTAKAAHWADPYAEQLMQWGVLSSTSDLRLDDEATRAEFVAMCNRAFGYTKLGGTPFIDVPSSAWYAQDIDIAYNAGYFKGTEDNVASPEDPLTREQAAVLIARNLVLQETVGESLGFTDSRELSEWSRGLIGAAVNEGWITGNEDGSFRPFNNITRGELAAMLVRAIGTPIRTAGNYEIGDVYGNVVISSSNVTLRNTVILGNLYITGGVDLGNVLLENVTVLGRIVVSGGGESDAAKSSVILRNVEADELVVDSMVGQFVTVSAYGLTDIPNTYVRSDSYLEDSSTSGYGLGHIELVGNSGTRLQIAGSIKEVVNKTPFSELQLVKGTAETITIDEYAKGSQLLIDINTRVDELNLDVATLVTGQGDIIDLNIGANGSEVDILPEHVEVRAGITSSVDGEIIGSSGAAELSAEPRLLAGYPTVTSLTPNQAEGLYASNKPGTIYWAISEIADGSVSVEDLINNPAYGGNIFENNAGSIDATAKTEYGRQITNLAPDGSYYISAVLVDGRGNRSPLKVASFTTPDDTLPAFVDGYPYMSKITCETAQVTAMANKSCQLYWVVLPAGATAPTAQQFKSGSVNSGSGYGYGSQSVAKNVPVSITVNTTRLQENTYYDLYLWLNDYNGAMSSEVFHVVDDSATGTKFSFRTPDETAPIVTSIMQTDYDQPAAAAVSFTVDEAPVDLYWAVVAESNESFITEDMSEQRQQLKVEFGTGAIVSGKKAAAGANADTEIGINEIKGLDYATYGTHSFKLYYVAKDAAGNYSEVGCYIIHTMDNDPPHAWLEFSEALNGKPRASSDVRIVFDEQVKGGANAAQTFRELYEEVETAAEAVKAEPNNSTYQSNLAAAKNKLATELAAHIRLYYSPKNGSPVLQTPRHELTDATNWVIDFTEAIITMEKGNLVIILPGTAHDGMNQALNLDSGASYQFRLVGVYDDAFTPNGVAVDVNDEVTCVPTGGKASESGNGTLYFTTLYAQVELYEDDTGISMIEGTDINLDMVVNVMPQSTSKTAATDSWDMVIRSDLAVQFNVYRRISTGTNWSAWELAAEGVTIFGTTSSSSSGGDLIAASLNNYKTTGTGGYINGVDFPNNVGGTQYIRGKYDTVVGALQEGHTYQYGISFTSVGGGAGATDRKSWTSLVQLRFSLVAGAPGNVQNLSDSANVNRSYIDLVNTRALLDEISTVDLGNTTGTVLEVEKQFRDERVPEFTSTSPELTAGTGTIDIDVALNRDGTVYYVVAPAGAIPTYTNNASNEVTSANDGSSFDDYKTLTSTMTVEEKRKYLAEHPEYASYDDYDTIEDWLAGEGIGNTFIPHSYEERENGTISNHIYFAAKDAAGIYINKYYAPTYDQIYSGGYRGELIRTGSIVYEGVKQTTRIAEGLEPGRWYYVYLVLQSTSGNLDQVVQIYRVKTRDVEPPAIIISPSGDPTSGTTDKNTYSSTTGVSMQINDRAGGPYDSPVLYYALARKDKLPDWFSDYYTWAEAGIEDSPIEEPDEDDPYVMTILEALIRKAGTDGESYFDMYASEALRNQVMQYITISTSDAQWGNNTRYYPSVDQNKLAENNPWVQNCTAELTMEGEYVMLVCARNSYKNYTVGTNYGFAAAQGLYKPDNVPPEFLSPKGTNGVVNASSWITGVWNRSSQWVGNDWPLGLEPRYYKYDGTITLTFSKEIYTYDKNDGNVLKQIVAKSSDEITEAEKDGTIGKRTQISILDVIDAPAGIFTAVSGNANNTSFTLTFQKITSETALIMHDLYNSSGSEEGKSPYTLTITFDSSKTEDELVEREGATDDDGGPIYDQFKRVVPCFNVSWS